MKQLSVLISYSSIPEELEDTLLSLLENRPDSCEILVIQNKTYENIYELNEDEVRFIPIQNQLQPEKRTALECFRKGLSQCNSDFIYLMPVGVAFQLPWWESALENLKKNESRGAFFLDENFQSGAFFRRSLLKELLNSRWETEFRKTETNTENLSTEARILSGETAQDLICSLAALLQEDSWSSACTEFEHVKKESTESDGILEVEEIAKAVKLADEKTCETESESSAERANLTETVNSFEAELPPVQKEFSNELTPGESKVILGTALNSLSSDFALLSESALEHAQENPQPFEKFAETQIEAAEKAVMCAAESVAEISRSEKTSISCPSATLKPAAVPAPFAENSVSPTQMVSNSNPGEILTKVCQKDLPENEELETEFCGEKQSAMSHEGILNRFRTAFRKIFTRTPVSE